MFRTVLWLTLSSAAISPKVYDSFALPVLISRRPHSTDYDLLNGPSAGAFFPTDLFDQRRAIGANGLNVPLFEYASIPMTDVVPDHGIAVNPKGHQSLPERPHTTDAAVFDSEFELRHLQIAVD
jgi:hypothetical protein